MDVTHSASLTNFLEEESMGSTPVPEPDKHKGAIEGDRPDDRQNSNPNGPGVDDEGLPDDPVASAQDRIGANVDESEGG